MFFCQCSDARAAGVIHCDQGCIHLFNIDYVCVCVGGCVGGPCMWDHEFGCDVLLTIALI